MTGRPRTRQDVALAAATGVAALAVYVRSLAPGLLWGDSAEFQLAAWLGGFVHPTGYPLYLLLGWVWSHGMPLGDPAFRMNLFSALWGGAAVALLSLVVMRVVRLLGDVTELLPRVVGVGTGLFFTFTPTFWSQAVIAEVYTLHAALVAGSLLALLAWAERFCAGDAAGARRRWYAAALLFGLSLAHHRSSLLLLAAALVFVAVVWRAGAARAHLGVSPALTLVALLTPLLLYLWIPLAAVRAPYAVLRLSDARTLPLYDVTLRGFVAHITGSVFASSLVAPRGPANFLALGVRFTEEWSANGLFLGGLGLAWLLITAVRRHDARVWALLGLTVSALLAQVAFNLFYAIGDIAVFYIPAYLVWAIWLGIGTWVLAQGLRWLLAARPALAVATGALAAAALLLALTGRSAIVQWPRVQRAGDATARTAWEALLAAPLPSDAILVSNDRDEMVPLWYLKYVEGRAPGMAGLFPLLQPGEDWADVVAVTEQALATGRPVYLVKPMPGLEARFDLGTPLGGRAGGLGPLVPVQAVVQASPQHPGAAVFGDTIRLLGYDLAWGGVDTLAITLWWQVISPPAADWTAFVQVLAQGDAKVGQSDHLPGGAYDPSSQWRAGDVIRDAHRIPLDAKGSPPGPYRLLAGWYREGGGELERLGAPQIIGEVQRERGK